MCLCVCCDCCAVVTQRGVSAEGSDKDSRGITCLYVVFKPKGSPYGNKHTVAFTLLFFYLSIRTFAVPLATLAFIVFNFCHIIVCVSHYLQLALSVEIFPV